MKMDVKRNKVGMCGLDSTGSEQILMESSNEHK
jgi:hypothetical protein